MCSDFGWLSIQMVTRAVDSNEPEAHEKRGKLFATFFLKKYARHLNTELVRFLNGPNMSGCLMVRFLNG